jgi:hypothetical protein
MLKDAPPRTCFTIGARDPLPRNHASLMSLTIKSKAQQSAASARPFWVHINNP